MSRYDDKCYVTGCENNRSYATICSYHKEILFACYGEDEEDFMGSGDYDGIHRAIEAWKVFYQDFPTD